MISTQITKLNLLRSILLTFSLSLSTQPIFAAEFHAPNEIIHSGQLYKLAFKNIVPNRALYEYTANEEPIDNWSRLLTIQYIKGMKATPEKWIDAMKKSLQRPYSNVSDALQASIDTSNPRIYDQFYVKTTHGYSRFIIAPDEKNASYESNVSKSFHLTQCEGLLLYQVAAKYPANINQPQDEKIETLMRIDQENKDFASELEANNWAPDCS